MDRFRLILEKVPQTIRRYTAFVLLGVYLPWGVLISFIHRHTASMHTKERMCWVWWWYCCATEGPNKRPSTRRCWEWSFLLIQVSSYSSSTPSSSVDIMVSDGMFVQFGIPNNFAENRCFRECKWNCGQCKKQTISRKHLKEKCIHVFRELVLLVSGWRELLAWCRYCTSTTTLFVYHHHFVDLLYFHYFRPPTLVLEGLLN